MLFLGIVSLILGIVCFAAVVYYLRLDNGLVTHFWQGAVALIGAWLFLAWAFPEFVLASTSPQAAWLSVPAGFFHAFGTPIFLIIALLIVVFGIIESAGTRHNVTLSGTVAGTPTAPARRQYDFIAVLTFVALILMVTTVWASWDGLRTFFPSLEPLPTYEASATSQAQQLSYEIDSRRASGRINFRTSPFMMDIHHQDLTIQGHAKWVDIVQNHLRSDITTSDIEVKEIERIHYEKRLVGRIEANITFNGVVRTSGKKFRGQQRLYEKLDHRDVEGWIADNAVLKLIELKELDHNGVVASTLSAPRSVKVVEVPKFSGIDVTGGTYDLGAP